MSKYGSFVEGRQYSNLTGVLQRATKALKRAQTTEFENWIVRVLLGGGGTRVRNPAKVITSYHTTVVGTSEKNNPAAQVHPALWKLCKPEIGKEESPKDKKGAKASAA